MPKSPSFTRRAAESRKFGGLRSRCRIGSGRRSWRYSTADAMSRQNRRHARAPGFFRGTCSSIVPPSIISTTSASAGLAT